MTLLLVCHNATYVTWSQDRRCAECGADLSVGWVRQGERVVLCSECRGEAENGC